MFVWLKEPDKRQKLFKPWDSWFKRVAKLHARFLKTAYDDDPFHYNETATVSLFASAACQGKMIALAEFVCFKKRKSDKREIGNGRSDLWVMCEESELSWSFEFKVHWYRSKISEDVIRAAVDNAYKDALVVYPDDSYGRFGVTAFSPSWWCEGDDYEVSSLNDAIVEYINNSSRDEVFCAFASKYGSKPIYFIFREV